MAAGVAVVVVMFVRVFMVMAAAAGIAVVMVMVVRMSMVMTAAAGIAVVVVMVVRVFVVVAAAAGVAVVVIMFVRVFMVVAAAAGVAVVVRMVMPVVMVVTVTRSGRIDSGGATGGRSVLHSISFFPYQKCKKTDAHPTSVPIPKKRKANALCVRSCLLGEKTGMEAYPLLPLAIPNRPPARGPSSQ